MSVEDAAKKVDAVFEGLSKERQHLFLFVAVMGLYGMMAAAYGDELVEDVLEELMERFE